MLQQPSSDGFPGRPGKPAALRLPPAEVPDRPGQLEGDLLEAGLGEPGVDVGAAGAGAEQAGEAADLAHGQVAQAGVGQQRAAGQDTAGVQHPGHLEDGAVRVGEAVQAGEGDDEVELTVGERKVPHVGEHRLDLGHDVALASDAHGAVQHRLGDVRGDVPDPLAGPQASQRHPTAGRDVEHRRARGLATDLRGGGVQPAQVAADPGLPQRPAGLRVLDGPVVELPPQRVVAPATEAGDAQPVEHQGLDVRSLRSLLDHQPPPVRRGR